MNPDIYGDYLPLNVDEDDSSIDFDLAIGAAPYYGIEENEATQMVGLIKNTANYNWQALAKKYGIGRGEIERMKPAFKVCEG